MVCCIVAALVVGLLQRLMPMRRHRSIDGGFAPPAFRPKPGAVAESKPALEPVRTLEPATSARIAWLVRFSALGAMTYLIVAPAMVAAGLTHNGASSRLWLLRTAAVLALVLGAVLVASVRHASQPLAWTDLAGVACLGVGLPWLELTEVDIHLLGAYSVANPLLDTALHGFGIGAVVIGLAFLVPLPRLRTA